VIKYHTFRGRKYRIEITEDLPPDLLGDCDNPKKKRGIPVIRIQKNQNLEQFLATGIHEALHAMAWDLSERAVLEIETDMVRFVLRLLRYYTQKDPGDFDG